jgi:flagellar basal-body rod protein FlgG
MMNGSLWVAKTGLDAQQTRMQVVSNNLANANTTGFKKDRAVFEDLLYQNIRQVGGQTSQQTRAPTGMHVGTGVRVVATEKLHSQGGINQTSNQLDVAISGRGFFQVQLPDGSVGYTRDGSFKLNEQSQLVTSSGNIISALVAGETTPQQLGTLQLTDFINPSGLQPRGENLYVESAASGSPQTGTAGLSGLGTLEQGALEGSNVNVVEELVNMIETQRGYEMNSKAISASDQMMQYLNNNV